MNYSKKGIKKKQKQLNSTSTKIEKMFLLYFLKAILICFIGIGIVGTCMGIGMFNGILASSPDISMASSSPSSCSSSCLLSLSSSSTITTKAATMPVDVVSFDSPSLYCQPSDLADPADPVHTSKAIQQFGEDAEVGGGYTLKDFPYAHIPPEIGKNATLQEVANVGE